MNTFFPGNKNSGMTFLEVVVVVGIFSVISAVVLFSYRDFSNSIRLQNLSQEIALQGKRAQTLASQGRRPILSQAQILNEGLLPFSGWVSSYGIAFRLPENNKSFFFYFNSPLYYDGGLNSSVTNQAVINNLRNLYFHDFIDGASASCGNQDSECVEEILISDGSEVSMICLNSEPSSDPNCSLGQESSELHISFTRPFLDAYILGDDINQPISNAFIKIISPSSDQVRHVTFWSSGQISVN